MGEVGLMFTGYNLCRCITVLGAEKLIRLLREYSFLIINAVRRFLRLNLKEYYPADKIFLNNYHLKLIALNPLTNNINW